MFQSIWFADMTCWPSSWQNGRLNFGPLHFACLSCMCPTHKAWASWLFSAACPPKTTSCQILLPDYWKRNENKLSLSFPRFCYPTVCFVILWSATGLGFRDPICFNSHFDIYSYKKSKRCLFFAFCFYSSDWLPFPLPRQCYGRACLCEKQNSFAPCQLCLNPPAFLQLLTAINTSLTPLFNHFHFQFKLLSPHRASGGLYSHCSGRGINDSQFECFSFFFNSSASSSSVYWCSCLCLFLFITSLLLTTEQLPKPNEKLPDPPNPVPQSQPHHLLMRGCVGINTA